MADTLTFIDYEFHFTSGDPLFVSIQEGMGTVEASAGLIHLETADKRDAITITRDKLNYFREIRRVEKVEQPQPFTLEAEQRARDGQ
jgi:hypothetical protein